jgi:adenine-specific DNA-methyltransferase
VAEPSVGYGDPDNENLLIQGDNLDALKSLLPVYAGRVKCIFRPIGKLHQ